MLSTVCATGGRFQGSDRTNICAKLFPRLRTLLTNGWHVRYHDRVVDGWATVALSLNKATRPRGSVAGFETYSTDGLLSVRGALVRGEHGGLIVSELTIRQMAAPHGVDANALRRIPVARIVAEVGARLANDYSFLIGGEDAEASEAVEAAGVARGHGRPVLPRLPLPPHCARVTSACKAKVSAGA